MNNQIGGWITQHHRLPCTSQKSDPGFWSIDLGSSASLKKNSPFL